jgi:hypothetical protein
VSGFSADWLALREPSDAAARSAALVATLRSTLEPGTAGAPLAIVDLGAGAGSNLRYLAPLLRGTQHWRLVDHDAQLLDAALATTATWARERGARVRHHGSTLVADADGLELRVQCQRADLARLDAIELPQAGLVTAAALLDLVSQGWLDALARRCHAAGAAVCFALTYDGRTTATPPEPEDAEALELFNRHQCSDKGFGPALGPAAPSAAERAFAALGFDTATAFSDWHVERQAATLQRALLDGWLGAAAEIAPARRTALESWHARRTAHVSAGRSELVVGHMDLVAHL